LYKQNSEKGKLYKKTIDTILPQVKEEIFNVNKPYKQLGYPSEGGSTAYFSPNMDK